MQKAAWEIHWNTFVLFFVYYIAEIDAQQFDEPVFSAAITKTPHPKPIGMRGLDYIVDHRHKQNLVIPAVLICLLHYRF